MLLLILAGEDLTLPLRNATVVLRSLKLPNVIRPVSNQNRPVSSLTPVRGRIRVMVRVRVRA